MPYLRRWITMANPTSSSPAATPLDARPAARFAPWLFALLVVASVLLVIVDWREHHPATTVASSPGR